MKNLRKHLAWMFSASLCWGTAVFAVEPQPLPPAAEASVDFDDVASRVGELQRRMERLEAENESLKHSLSQQTQPHGVTQANVANVEMMYAYPLAASSGSSSGGSAWKTGWNNGIEWASEDKQFKVHIGGRTQFDSVWVGQQDHALDGAGGINGSKAQDAVDFSRARLQANGTIYETIDYLAEFDFVNSQSVDPNATGSPGANTVKNTVKK